MIVSAPSPFSCHKKSYTASARRITSDILSAWVTSRNSSRRSLISSGMSRFSLTFGCFRLGRGIVLSLEEKAHEAESQDRAKYNVENMFGQRGKVMDVSC